MNGGLRTLISLPCAAGPSRLPTALRATCRQSPISTIRHQARTRSTTTHPGSLAAESSSGSSGAGQSGGGPSRDDYRRAWEANHSRYREARRLKNQSNLLYSLGAIVIMSGVTYAAIPLYRAFCSATGFAGTPMTDPTKFTPDRLYTTPETEGRKRITVHFQATSSDILPWKFEPQQRSIKVLPGETALAFYKAKNTSDQDIIGIATYNMSPERVAPYFAKVECFCFEEQKIRAGEEVDLPVFFFIDRDIMDEPNLNNLDDIILSYTFFKARRNDKGHAIPDAPESVVLASQGFDKYEHGPVKQPS